VDLLIFYVFLLKKILQLKRSEKKDGEVVFEVIVVMVFMVVFVDFVVMVFMAVTVVMVAMVVTMVDPSQFTVTTANERLERSHQRFSLTEPRSPSLNQ
jgi:MFS superfamily sulfate permease-like transporter